MHASIDLFATPTHVFILSFRANISVWFNFLLVYKHSNTANLVMTRKKLKPFKIGKPCVLLRVQHIVYLEPLGTSIYRRIVVFVQGRIQKYLSYNCTEHIAVRDVE